MAARRLQKRKEAEARNAKTPIERTAFWRTLTPEERAEWMVQSASAVS